MNLAEEIKGLREARNDMFKFSSSLMIRLNMFAMADLQVFPLPAAMHTEGNLEDTDLWWAGPRQIGEWPSKEIQTTTPFHIMAKSAVLFYSVYSGAYKVGVPFFTPSVDLANQYPHAGGVGIVGSDGRCSWAIVSMFAAPWDLALATIFLWDLRGYDVRIINAAGGMNTDVVLRFSVAKPIWSDLAEVLKMKECLGPYLAKEVSAESPLVVFDIPDQKHHVTLTLELSSHEEKLPL